MERMICTYLSCGFCFFPEDPGISLCQRSFISFLCSVFMAVREKKRSRKKGKWPVEAVCYLPQRKKRQMQLNQTFFESSLATSALLSQWHPGTGRIGQSLHMTLKSRENAGKIWETSDVLLGSDLRHGGCYGQVGVWRCGFGTEIF